MTLLAGFAALPSRYTGQEDIVLGVPLVNRTRRELEEMIGFFANTLALRTKLSGNPTFRKLVEELKPERSLSIHPVFQVLFSLQNAPRASFELKDLSAHASRQPFRNREMLKALTQVVVKKFRRPRIPCPMRSR
jgi:surfactin family lipopeptide synthetase A